MGLWMGGGGEVMREKVFAKKKRMMHYHKGDEMRWGDIVRHKTTNGW